MRDRNFTQRWSWHLDRDGDLTSDNEKKLILKKTATALPDICTSTPPLISAKSTARLNGDGHLDLLFGPDPHAPPSTSPALNTRRHFAPVVVTPVMPRAGIMTLRRQRRDLDASSQRRGLLGGLCSHFIARNDGRANFTGRADHPTVRRPA